METDASQMLMQSITSTFRDFAGLAISGWSSKKPADLLYTNVFFIDNFQPEEIRLQFYFSLEGKKLLVERILSEKWETLNHQYIDDCLLEVINIIGGNFLSRYYMNRKHEVGLPFLCFDDRDMGKGTMFYFQSEGILFGVSIQTDQIGDQP